MGKAKAARNGSLRSILKIGVCDKGIPSTLDARKLRTLPLLWIVAEVLKNQVPVILKLWRAIESEVQLLSVVQPTAKQCYHRMSQGSPVFNRPSPVFHLFSTKAALQGHQKSREKKKSALAPPSRG